MCLQVPLLDKLLWAVGAGVALVVLVEPLVCFQVAKLTEALAADETLKGLLACVHTHVCLQIADLIEGFLARGAGVRLAVPSIQIDPGVFAVELHERHTVARRIRRKVVIVHKHVVQMEHLWRAAHGDAGQGRNGDHGCREHKGHILVLVPHQPQIVAHHGRLLQRGSGSGSGEVESCWGSMCLHIRCEVVLVGRERERENRSKEGVGQKQKRVRMATIHIAAPTAGSRENMHYQDERSPNRTPSKNTRLRSALGSERILTTMA
jgi:hypothetical protein